MSVFSSYLQIWNRDGLFHLGGEYIYQKLSQMLEEVFNRLTTQHCEYQSCGSSLAAFIIEKGKSGLIVFWGVGNLFPQSTESVGAALWAARPGEPATISGFRWAAWSGSSGDRRMQLQPALWVLWEALAWQSCHCHCQAFPAQVCLCKSFCCSQFVSVLLLYLNFIVT